MFIEYRGKKFIFLPGMDLWVRRAAWECNKKKYKELTGKELKDHIGIKIGGIVLCHPDFEHAVEDLTDTFRLKGVGKFNEHEGKGSIKFKIPDKYLTKEKVDE